MLVIEQAEAQARGQANAPVITVMSGGWHQGVIGIVAGRLKDVSAGPRSSLPKPRTAPAKARAGRSRGRSRRGGAGRQGQRPADRGRRPCHGGGADSAAGRARSLPRLHQRAARRRRRKSRGDKALLLDLLLAPGGIAGALCDALDEAGPYGAGWPSPRVAAGPVRLLKTGDRRRRPCPPGSTAGDDGKSFQVDRLPERRRHARPGSAGVGRRHPLVARGSDQARRVERRQCGRDAPRRRRACLTLKRPLA